MAQRFFVTYVLPLLTIVFAEQRERLLTIANKIDILIMDNYLITNNIPLLQKHFGFQDYVYQSAQQTIQCIIQKNLIENTEKLTEYISRGKSKYAKKMMRIGSSMRCNSSSETSAKEASFGKNCCSRSLVFSFVPHCHGEYGSQKYTFISVASINSL